MPPADIQPALHALENALTIADPVAIETLFQRVEPHIDPSAREALRRYINDYAYADAAQWVWRLQVSSPVDSGEK